MELKEIARAFQIGFGMENGKPTGEGVTMMAQLAHMGKVGSTHGTMEKGEDGHIDQTALILAIGRRQYYDELYSLLTMDIT